MTHASAVAFVEDFERVASGLPGAGVPWLARLRRDALERFAASGIPTRREEAWKHTSLAALEKVPFTTQPNGSGRDHPAKIDSSGQEGRLRPLPARRGTLPVQDVFFLLRGASPRHGGSRGQGYI